MQQNYINHYAFLLDKSGSIRNAGLENSIVEVFDNQIKHLKIRSAELEQEARISVYLFNEKVECLFFDIDVNKVPSLSRFYKANGDTAMIDAMLKVISDLSKINTMYGDHAFLIYCLTDGQNRINNNLANKLNKEIISLPENYTTGALVPDADGIFECKKFGFPANNIKVWETTKRGAEEVSNTMSSATDHYMMARSSGLRSTKNLFSLDASNLRSAEVKRKLEELKPYEYELLNVNKESYIKDYIESWRLPFVKGSNYYQITKPETLQSYKQICIQDKVNGKIYTGIKARELLGIPDFEVKVNPNNYGKYNVFIQSSSSNRKLVKGTQLIVLK